MAYCERPLILASASPRRRELLSRFGVPFRVVPARGKELAPEGLTPGELVKCLAEHKAAEVAGNEDADSVIVAADTVVEIDGEILGKPSGPADAGTMLRRLSGRTHRVWTGVCVRRGDRILSAAEETAVRFRELDDDEIRAYVATGEPLDKAGAYGIQGYGAMLVEGIRGDYFTVMGLPVCRLAEALKRFGLDPVQQTFRP